MDIFFKGYLLQTYDIHLHNALRTPPLFPSYHVFYFNVHNQRSLQMPVVCGFMSFLTIQLYFMTLGGVY